MYDVNLQIYSQVLQLECRPETIFMQLGLSLAIKAKDHDEKLQPGSVGLAAVLLQTARTSTHQAWELKGFSTSVNMLGPKSGWHTRVNVFTPKCVVRCVSFEASLPETCASHVLEILDYACRSSIFPHSK